jgi:hypothetical protein
VSLLGLVQDVCALLSLPQPASVVASTDKQVLQLLALANEEGLELSRRHAWQALTEEATFATVAAAAQPAAIPADLDRFIPGSFFNRTTRLRLVGPIPPREWQQLQASAASGRAYLSFRERQGVFLMTPTPPAGQLVAYEYVSSNWARSQAGAAQAAFLADTDTSFLDEALIKRGLRWRYLRAKGLDYAEELQTYERMVETCIARDGAAAILALVPGGPDPARINAPDGGFGGH